jgi:hypothetical protein
VLSPIIFNLFIEVLLRHVNAHAAEYGVEIAAVEAARAGATNLPLPLQLLALAYADDVVLVCPNLEAAQAALRLVQDWAADFGMTIGIGQGKSMAMFVSAETVVEACKNDVNGMLKRNARAPVAVDAVPDADPAPPEAADYDDDMSTVLGDPDDDEWLPGDDPVVEQPRPPMRSPSLRKGQVCVNGEVRGAGTGKPRPYEPRPLPGLPPLPPLHIAVRSSRVNDPVDVDVPWTNLYKYLGFMLRSDLLDDHAYERVEKKTKAAAERLFPHHRLVKAWPLGLKLQTLQTLVLSVTSNVMPLLTSMRCASESKTVRLDQLRKKIARDTLRLQGSARHAYVTAEAGLGDVMGDITQHRIRLSLSLWTHPLRNLPSPPIACRILEIMHAETDHFSAKKHNMLLAPWTYVTRRITNVATEMFYELKFRPPNKRRKVAPFAAMAARFTERNRWITRMKHDIDWMSDSFALRPPPGTRRQTAALHWVSRLRWSDAGTLPKLTPLSYRGPRGSPIVSLSRRRSRLTCVISSMRQGNASMQRFPFTASKRNTPKVKGSTGNDSYEKQTWKTCHFCADDDTGPRYDLWHVLFECPTTCNSIGMIGVRDACKAFVPQLCDAIELAVARNAESLRDTRNAGVSHDAITAAIDVIRMVSRNYDWDCTPGKWLIYTVLLALPFPEVAVRPDAVSPIWLCPPKRKRNGAEPPRNLRGMPVFVPVLPDAQYSLPCAMGRLFDKTVLSNDALRPMADSWCSLATANLLRAGAIVRPLRMAADLRRLSIGTASNDAASTSNSSDESASSTDSDSDPA